MSEMSLTLKPVTEATARRAVADVDADIIEAGGSRAQADAVRSALKMYFLGEIDGARTELSTVFDEDMVERLLEEFRRGAEAAA